MLVTITFQCYSASIGILSCFFIFLLVMSNNFLMIPVVREKIKVKLALAIPTGAPIVVVNEIIDIPPVVTIRTFNIL